MVKCYFYDGVFVEEPIEYDDIVDRSSFVLDSETVRNARLGSSGAASGVPMYDGDLPSKDIVALRSGKLDIADVSQLQRDKAREIKADSDKREAYKDKEIAQARLDYLDKTSGFDAERVKLETQAQK